MISLLLLGGCGSHQANSTTKASAKKETSTKVTHKKKKPAEPKKSTTDNNQQTNNAAADKPVQKTNSAPQPPKTPAMNLNEIKNGSYASIVGSWKEVAICVNHYDTKGIRWGNPDPELGDSITITNSQVMDKGYILSGDVIQKKDEMVNEPPKAQAQMRNGALEIGGDAGADAVSFDFYPKGVNIVPSDWGFGTPTTINKGTDQILIRTSNMGYVQVYERVTN